MDKIKKWLPLGAAVAGVLALILYIACPAVVAEAFGVKESYSGAKAMFGFESWGEKVKGIFWCVVALILLVAAVVVSVLSYMKPENKLFALIAAACFAVAAIFLFSTKGFFCTGHEIQKEVAEFYKLGAGSIIAAILSIVGAGAAICPVVLKD